MKMFVFLSLILSAQLGWAQSGIRGAIKSGSQKIANVNVYVNNTLRKVATDANGFFALPDLESGLCQLVVSKEGYVTVNQTLNLKANKEVELVINLTKLKKTNLGNKELSSRQQDLSTFKKHLLGEGTNATYCSILNEDALKFSTDATGKLSIRANQTLKIENKAIGLRVFYDLENMEVVKEKTTCVGTMWFEELQPQNETQLANWQKQRKATFNQSLRGFLSALSNDDMSNYSISFINPSKNSQSISNANLEQFMAYGSEQSKALLFNEAIEVKMQNPEQQSVIKTSKNKLSFKLNGRILE
jgi:hypothetical protein